MEAHPLLVDNHVVAVIPVVHFSGARRNGQRPVDPDLRVWRGVGMRRTLWGFPGTNGESGVGDELEVGVVGVVCCCLLRESFFPQL